VSSAKTGHHCFIAKKHHSIHALGHVILYHRGSREWIKATPLLAGHRSIVASVIDGGLPWSYSVIVVVWLSIEVIVCAAQG
jgi:hypothetical protein